MLLPRQVQSNQFQATLHKFSQNWPTSLFEQDTHWQDTAHPRPGRLWPIQCERNPCQTRHTSNQAGSWHHPSTNISAPGHSTSMAYTAGRVHTYHPRSSQPHNQNLAHTALSMGLLISTQFRNSAKLPKQSPKSAAGWFASEGRSPAYCDCELVPDRH